MPVYEYICDDCQVQFEKRVRFSQANETQPCPECGQEHTHKLLSTFAVGGSSSQTTVASSAAPSSGFS